MKYNKIWLLGVLIFSLNGFGRFAHYEEASAEAEFVNISTVVKKSGVFTQTLEKQVKILNETGRSSCAIERFQFNDNIEKVEVIEAKTIIDGKEYKVAKGSIEIKPLASQSNAFDQHMQILISYPRVEIGASVYLKLRITVFKPSLPHHFGERIAFADGFAYKSLNATIKSEIPLNVLTNDPHQRLTVTQTKDGKNYGILIKSKTPAFDALMSEPRENFLLEEQKTWVMVSSLESFEEFAKIFAADYARVISQELPLLHEFVKIAAEGKSSSVEQINTVTSMLAEKINYMGDWRTVDGKFRPRPLAKVAESGLGDCKDFSASTAAILRALGYEVHVALVFRSPTYLAPQKALPMLGAFNHAIVKAVSKSGEVFWIDPTNFSSMADGIYPDIADRPALVLAVPKAHYERVPAIDAKHAKRGLVETLTVKNGNTLRVEGVMSFSGENAEWFAGISLRASPKSVGEMLLKELSGERSLPYQHINVPKLESRIVNDVSISYTFEKEDALLLTNRGQAMLLQNSWPAAYLSVGDDQEGATFVNLPVTLEKTTQVIGIHDPGANKLAYEINTPWLSAQRSVKATAKGLEIKDEVKVHKSWIMPHEARSKEFKELKSTLKKYSTRLALIAS